MRSPSGSGSMRLVGADDGRHHARGNGVTALGDFLAGCASLGDEALAEAIEADGRDRIARAERLELQEYLRVLPALARKPVSLDAAIDMVLRSMAGSHRPTNATVDSLVSAFPALEGPIRDAATLNAAMWTTEFPAPRESRFAGTLPRPFGPPAADGCPQYELIRVLGEGSFGEVVLARDRVLSEAGHDALVAIKMLRPGLGSTEPGRRLLREAARARRVDHPNVARVLQYGTSPEGDEYIVYEFVDGVELGKWAKTKPLPLAPREAALLIERTARGVQAAHSAGLTHCDLKPSNIMIAAGGEPKVIDFGIAASDTAQEPIPACSRPQGALAFISPEQYRGEPQGAAPSSDVYALGGLLYWLLTGLYPNGDTPAEVARRHARHGDGATRAAALPSPIDADLRAICARALGPSPSERYSAAALLADDLESWRLRLPIRWRRPGPLRKARLWAQRSPWLAASVAATSLTAAAAAAAMHAQQSENERIRRAEEVARARAEEGEHVRQTLGQTSAAILAQHKRMRTRGWEGASLALTAIYAGLLEGPAAAHDITADFAMSNADAARANLARSLGPGGSATLASSLWQMELARWLVSAGQSDEPRQILAELKSRWSGLDPGGPLTAAMAILDACAEANGVLAAAYPAERGLAPARHAASRLESVLADSADVPDRSLLRALALSRLQSLYAPGCLNDPIRQARAADERDALVKASRLFGS